MIAAIPQPSRTLVATRIAGANKSAHQDVLRKGEQPLDQPSNGPLTLRLGNAVTVVSGWNCCDTRTSRDPAPSADEVKEPAPAHWKPLSH